MEGNIKLPEDYVEFDSLKICSNDFAGGKIIIKVNNNIPLLVGKGVLPLIWLSIPVKEDNWEYIVERNISRHPKLIVELSKEKESVIIKLIEGKFIKDIIILMINKVSDDEAIINEMDLRPLGLNIYGDEKSLHIGTNTLSNNSFTNVHTMIAIGR